MAYVAMPMSANGLDEARGVEALDGLLARSKDVSDEDDISAIERANKIVKTVSRARIAMRLKRHDDATTKRRLRRRERHLDLGRMVRIIVDHRHAVDLADDGETALNPFEGLERARDDLMGDAKLIRDGDGGERVEHIMIARHAHLDAPPALALNIELKGDAEPLCL